MAELFMHREGHIGTALIVYAPIGAVTLALGFAQLSLLGAVAAAGLSTLPDIDQRLPGIDHRGPTHTIWFVIAVGLVAGSGGVVAGSAHGILAGLALGTWAFLLASATITSHLMADVITPAGICPFTPIRDDCYTFDLTRAANPAANIVLLVIGLVVTTGALAVGNALASI